MIGQTLGHYRIEAKLGEGGMGVVYRALDTHLERPVAIKVLHAEVVADLERKRRFVQEAKAASALNHPNIITIYDIGTADGVDFIAMEYVPGKTLDAVVGRKGLHLGEALKYAVQIADALAKAHAAGIVHRDIKPANIMVTDQGLVKTLDFGLAKLTEPVQFDEFASTQTQKPRTEEGAILGTVAYMSPEQAEGKPVDTRSDIFSFGSVFYEMLTGRRAFQGETKLSTLTAILREEPKPASEVIEGVPRELERVIARCLRKDSGRRFQTMADLKVALEELKEESDSGRLISGLPVAAKPVRHRSAMAMAIATGLVLVAAVFAVAWWLRRTPAPAPGLILTRLTSDSGLTTDPALSPDGKLLAYASDRSGEGNLDIWVQHVTDGDAVRLTRHQADEHEPSFSPDGSKIAFRSEREGGGLCVISALGGDARMIAEHGRSPRFSPDGNQVAYWVGGLGGDLSTPGTGKIWVVGATGGPPRQFQPAFAAARYPIWSPDGRRLLFFGTRDPKDPPEERYDWWVAPLEGGTAIKTGALGVFQRQKLSGYSFPGIWRSEANHVVFSARLGDSTNLWQVPLSPGTWQVTDAAQRLTFGTGVEVQPSIVAGGLLVFSNLIENTDVWSLPIDANQGKVRGEIQRLTSNAAVEAWPSASGDGKKIVFASQRSGNWNVWIKDLASGKETGLTVTPSDEAYPIISADGSKVAYEMGAAIYVVAAGGGVPQKVCQDCGTPWHWSSDGKKILYRSRQPRSQGLLNVASGEKIELLQHPEYNLYQAHFSADDRWISFLAWISPLRTRIFIVPFGGGVGPGVSEWIAVTDGESADDKPRWSPDGNLIYFTSERDGFRCIWAQRLDPATKRPVGSTFPVYHSHSARLSLMNVGLGHLEMSVAADKLVFNLGERTGNIWMAKLQ